MKKRSKLYLLLAMAIVTIAGSSCSKDGHYLDSGLQNGKLNMSSYAFLQSKPIYFDTVVAIIEAAGLKETLSSENVTFFAPTNFSILKAMNIVNAQRYSQNKDSLYIRDIPGEIWRKFLTRYVFRDKFMLKDIARWDSRLLQLFAGQNLESMDGYLMNLGVQFSDYGGTKDVGPRKVIITDIGDLSNPVNITANVGTSDLQTTNGIVHVLDFEHTFAFNSFAFANAVQDYFQ